MRPLRPWLQSDLRGHLFAVPDVTDIYHVAHLAGAEGVSEVVQILDRFVTEANENIASFQPRFVGWGSRSDVREPHSFGHRREVRNGSEVRSIPAASAGRNGAACVRVR